GIQVPIIAMTANAMKGDEEICRQAGCSGYISKPIDQDNLLNTIFNALSNSLSAAPTSFETPQTQTLAAPQESTESGQLFSTLPMDDADFRQIVEQFRFRLAEKIVEMQTALQNSDFPELARLAHWLKGTGGGAGFAILTDLAVELERAAKASQPSESE